MMNTIIVFLIFFVAFALMNFMLFLKATVTLLRHRKTH